nr:antitoxin MazE-like protein [Parasaccharibacter sp. TMW 2.1891]
MRPVQLWVPDTRRPDFTREASRQARLIRACDEKRGDDMAFSELAAAQIEGWE